MHRTLLVLCLLANFGLVLMPLSTLHAHIDQEHLAVQVHGGHDHDFGGSVSEEGSAHVVDLQISALARAVGTLDWTHWLPLFCVAVVLFANASLSTSLLRPPPPTHPPNSRSRFFQPPLRGPPNFR